MRWIGGDGSSLFALAAAEGGGCSFFALAAAGVVAAVSAVLVASIMLLTKVACSSWVIRLCAIHLGVGVDACGWREHGFFGCDDYGGLVGIDLASPAGCVLQQTSRISTIQQLAAMLSNAAYWLVKAAVS